MASICNDDGASLSVMSGHERKTLRLSDCKVHRDLKLGLLGQPDALHLARSAALLALVVRHARDWFLGEHDAAYRRSTLVWSMRLGQPAATNLAAAHAQVFRQIGLAAWAASFQTGDCLPVESEPPVPI